VDRSKSHSAEDPRKAVRIAELRGEAADHGLWRGARPG
jgi:hypothetical protein